MKQHCAFLIKLLSVTFLLLNVCDAQKIVAQEVISREILPKKEKIQSTIVHAEDTSRALNELIISTEKLSSFHPSARVLSVINSEEITKVPAENIQDLLRYVRGADTRSRGAEGVQADINVLGGTFDQTIVLINGINFSDPQTGHHSLNIPIEISQIERIEILQGPGAWSGSSSAFSGAINIVTKDAHRNELTASLTAGEYGFFKGAANISFVSGSISGQVGGGYSGSGGYSENTDFKIGNFFTSVTYRPVKGHTLSFSGGFQSKNFGAASFYTPAYPEQYEETKVLLSSLEYALRKDRWQIRVSLYNRVHYDRFELFRFESPGWYTGHNYHRSNVTGASAEVALSWGEKGITVAGAEYRNESILSSVIGDPLYRPVRAIFEEEIFYSKGKVRHTPGLYLKHIVQISNLRLTAGLLAGNTITAAPQGESSAGSSRTGICAGLAAEYKITPRTELNGWVNNSYRNPTFTDLYYKSPNQTGNAGLKPEEAVAAQIGFKFSGERFNAGVSVFYRHGYRIIDWTRDSGSDQWSAGNHTNVNSEGVELSWDYRPGGFINNLGMNYAYLNVIKESAAEHSLYATDFLRHRASLYFDHKIFGRVKARWDLNYRKREGSYLDVSNNEVPYKGFLLADVKIIYALGMTSIYVEASNLSDTGYMHIGNIPQPGRWIKCGVNLVL